MSMIPGFAFSPVQASSAGPIGAGDNISGVNTGGLTAWANTLARKNPLILLAMGIAAAFVAVAWLRRK